MKKIWAAIVASTLIAISCQAESPSNAGGECSSDATCVLSSSTADCCPRCKPFSAPSNEVAAMEDKCHAMSPVAGRCPELKCPPHEGPDYFAKCVQGRCVVGP